MYNLRIVPAGIRPVNNYGIDPNPRFDYIYYRDTIPCPSEWTAEEAVEILKMPKKELDEIGERYFIERHQWSMRSFLCPWSVFIPISEYVSAVISLAPLKGLTVEEIKKLSEVRI